MSGIWRRLVPDSVPTWESAAARRQSFSGRGAIRHEFHAGARSTIAPCAQQLAPSYPARSSSMNRRSPTERTSTFSPRDVGEAPALSLEELADLGAGIVEADQRRHDFGRRVLQGPAPPPNRPWPELFARAPRRKTDRPRRRMVAHRPAAPGAVRKRSRGSGSGSSRRATAGLGAEVSRKLSGHPALSRRSHSLLGLLSSAESAGSCLGLAFKQRRGPVGVSPATPRRDEPMTESSTASCA